MKEHSMYDDSDGSDNELAAPETTPTSSSNPAPKSEGTEVSSTRRTDDSRTFVNGGCPALSNTCPAPKRRVAASIAAFGSGSASVNAYGRSSSSRLAATLGRPSTSSRPPQFQGETMSSVPRLPRATSLGRASFPNHPDIYSRAGANAGVNSVSSAVGSLRPTSARSRPNSASRVGTSQAGGQPLPSLPLRGHRPATASNQLPSVTSRSPTSSETKSQATMSPSTLFTVSPAPFGVCSRSKACDGQPCVDEYRSLGVASAKTARSYSCTSNWFSLPDVVLLQTMSLLGPAEVCATASVCSSWAEGITASETWLWSSVGGIGLPDGVFSLLETWSKASETSIRNALQLWVCRAHLWGADNFLRRSSTSTAPSSKRGVVCVGSCVGPLPSDSTAVCCTAWPGVSPGPEGPGVAIGFADGNLFFGSVVTEQDPCHSLHGVACTGFKAGASVRSAHGQSLITALRPLSSSGQAVVSSGLDGLLRVWDTSTAAESLQIITNHEWGINDVSVGPAETEPLLLSCGEQGHAFLHSPESGAGRDALSRFEGHSAPAYCCVWTSCSTFATGGFDRRTLLWDRRCAQKALAALPSRQHVYSLAHLNSGQCLALGTADGTIVQFDLRHVQKTPLREMRGHTGAVESMSVMPGDVLVSASADGNMRLWDAARTCESTWLWPSPGKGALTGSATVLEDTILLTGHAILPTLLSLNYKEASPSVAEMLERLQLPSLAPWRRARGEAYVPPEGHGRHSNLLQRSRSIRGSARSSSKVADRDLQSSLGATMRGSFDRPIKPKAVPLGATGAAHRSFLCGLRR